MIKLVQANTHCIGLKYNGKYKKENIKSIYRKLDKYKYVLIPTFNHIKGKSYILVHAEDLYDRGKLELQVAMYPYTIDIERDQTIPGSIKYFTFESSHKNPADYFRVSEFMNLIQGMSNLTVKNTNSICESELGAVPEIFIVTLLRAFQGDKKVTIKKTSLESLDLEIPKILKLNDIIAFSEERYDICPIEDAPKRKTLSIYTQSNYAREGYLFPYEDYRILRNNRTTFHITYEHFDKLGDTYLYSETVSESTIGSLESFTDILLLLSQLNMYDVVSHNVDVTMQFRSLHDRFDKVIRIDRQCPDQCGIYDYFYEMK